MKALVYGLIMVVSLILASCGGGGSGGLNLVGNLSLQVAQTGTNPAILTATAVYTHPTKDTLGVELTFLVNTYVGGTLVNTTGLTKKQAAGGLELPITIFPDAVADTIVDITVSTGDLLRFKRVVIPKLSVAEITVLPALADFTPVTVVLPASINLAISGGGGPTYRISSLPAALTGAGITASLAGSTLVVGDTNLALVGTSGVIQIECVETGKTLDIIVKF